MGLYYVFEPVRGYLYDYHDIVVLYDDHLTHKHALKHETDRNTTLALAEVNMLRRLV